MKIIIPLTLFLSSILSVQSVIAQNKKSLQEENTRLNESIDELLKQANILNNNIKSITQKYKTDSVIWINKITHLIADSLQKQKSIISFQNLQNEYNNKIAKLENLNELNLNEINIKKAETKTLKEENKILSEELSRYKINYKDSITNLKLKLAGIKLDNENNIHKITNNYSTEINILKDTILRLKQNPSFDIAEEITKPYIKKLTLNVIDTLDGINGKLTTYWNYPGTSNSSGIYAEGNILQNRRNGFWKYYLCNGRLSREGNFLNGLRNGYWRTYTTEYMNRLNFICEYYDIESKHFVEIEKYNQDQLIDTVYYLDKNKNLLFYYLVDQGVFYYSNHQPLSKNNLSNTPYPMNDIPNSENINQNWSVFYKNGKIKYTNKTEGDLFTEFFYLPDGSLVKKAVYINGVGEITVFGSNREVISSYQWQLGAGKWGKDEPCQ